MFKLFLRCLNQSSVRPFFQFQRVNHLIRKFVNRITNNHKIVLKMIRCVLSKIGTTLVLSVLLSACGGGSSSNNDTTPNTTLGTPTLSISSSSLTLNENFTGVFLVATATNATGIVVNQSSTGVVTVTVTTSSVRVSSIANANGQTTLTITANNSSLSTTAQVVVTVIATTQSASVPTTPILSISSSRLTLNENFSGAFLVATATNATGVMVNESSTGVVSVIVTTSSVRVSSLPSANGRTTLTITANNSSLSTTAQVVVTVIATTQPTSVPTTPTLSISSSRLTLNENFSGVFLVATATNATGVMVNESSTGVVAITVTTSSVRVSSIPNANGRTTLTITANNSSLSTTAQVVVTVIATTQPTSVPTTPTLSISSSSLTLDENFSGTFLVATATNATGIMVNQSSTGVVAVTVTTSSVRVSSIPSVNGRTTLTITANNSSLSTSAQVVVTVIATTQSESVPTTPILSISSSRLTLGENFSGTFLVATATNATGIMVNHSSTGVVSVIVTTSSVRVSSIPNANGRTTLTITANNSSFNINFQVVVEVLSAPNLNTAPTFSLLISNLSLDEDFDLTRLFATANNVNQLTIQPSSTGVVNFSTAIGFDRNSLSAFVSSIENANGRTTLTITASSGALSITSQVVVIVNPMNDKPVLTVSTFSLTLNEDYTVPVLIGTTKTDVDGDTLTLSVTESNTGVVTVTTSAAGVSLSSIGNATGQTTLSIIVSDGNLSASTQVIVTVININDPPTLTVSTNDISILNGFVPLIIDTTASDVDEGTLPFSVQVTTTGVVSITTSVASIVLSPISDGSGRTTLTVRTTDNAGFTTMQVIVINVVVNLSATPVLAISTNFISVPEDFATPVVIGTTATDTDPGTLVITVSASTNLVNTLLSTNSITLSSVENLNGITTLTVRATDAGGLFDSTEIVVVVNSINDTPTLTISSRTVSLGADPITLNVSASDVDDGILSYSVSTGQSVVNILITTTSLQLTRQLSSSDSQAMLTLRATDSDGATVSTSLTLILPPVFAITTGIKTLNFAWSAVSTATHYRLQTNPDGGSGYVDLTSTRGIVINPNGTTISQTTAQARVSLHRYITMVNDPQYGVQTCDSSSCGASFVHNTLALTNAQLNALAGQFLSVNSGVGDQMGAAVSISRDGNTLAASGRYEDGSTTGVNGADNNDAIDSGAAYVFRKIGNTWSQEAYIKASNAGAGDHFGRPLSLSSDGNTLAVGARNEDSSSVGVNGLDNDLGINHGAVYVFRRTGGIWTQQAYIKAPITIFNFGQSVSLSADGHTLAVGAVRGIFDAGVGDGAFVYRFNLSSNTWSLQSSFRPLVPSPSVNYGTPSNPSINRGEFGRFVSLNTDGNTLAVSAFSDHTSSTGVNGTIMPGTTSASGAVYIYRYISNAWTQQAFIKASNAGEGDLFGSLSLSGDGNTLAVGALREDSTSTGVNGEINDSTTDSGAAYVFRFNSGVWSQQAYIKPFNTSGGDIFGWNLSLSGDGNTLAVGTSDEDGSATGINGVDSNSVSNSGAAYIFEFNNNTWSQRAYIKAGDNSANSWFGNDVSLDEDGSTLAIGSPGRNSRTGAVYLY